jgi:hypothetical protein
MVAVKVGGLHDGLDVLILKADLVDCALPGQEVDLKPLIVAIISIYCLSETINLFFFLFLCVFNELIIFSAN